MNVEPIKDRSPKLTLEFEDMIFQSEVRIGETMLRLNRSRLVLEAHATAAREAYDEY